MTEHQRTTAAFQELSHNYEETVDQELRKFWQLSYPHFVNLLLEFTHVGEMDSVLDLATGTGLIPRTLAAKQGIKGRVVGLDFTYHALEIGKRKLDGCSTVSLTCASALWLPFAANSFDCVICALAAHHLDRALLLEQIRTVLKPGGRFIFADVTASPAWRLPGVKILLRTGAFLYFLLNNSLARAWVESGAVSHVLTADQWTAALKSKGFTQIVTKTLAAHRVGGSSAMMLSSVIHKPPPADAWPGMHDNQVSWRGL